MTHAMMLGLATFALAIPGAVSNTIDLIQKAKKKRGRMQAAAFSEKHPKWSMGLTILMIGALIVGFWLVLNPPSAGQGQPGNPPQSAPQTAPQPAPTPQPKAALPKQEKAPASPKQAAPPTVRFGGSLTQTTGAPCSGNSVTGSVDNSGCQVGNVLPPARSVPRDKFAEAVEILETAPEGSKVGFTIVGGSEEISSFVRQLQALFGRAKDKWTVEPSNYDGRIEMSIISNTGVIADHGEGIHCGGVGNKNTFQIAKKAMSVAGFPCERSFNPGNSGDDFDIMVGTRIPRE